MIRTTDEDSRLRAAGKLLRAAAALLILLIALSPGAALAQSATGDCEALLERLAQEPRWRETLQDPAFESQEEEQAFLERYRPLHTCLEEAGEDLNAEQAQLRRLGEYFLIFSSGYGEPEQPSGNGSTFWRIDPAESQDPALVGLREEAGVPPPPGFFYVRLYPSTLAMPSLLQKTFSNEEVAGVTLQARYIAVLVVDDLRFQNRGRLDNETLDVLSHELVHAYVSASIGAGRVMELPAWFREGLAIFFSGGGKSYTYFAPGSVFRRGPTEAYRAYDQVFRYLESRTGREELLRRSRQAILAADPSLLYQDLGMEDDESFLLAVADWTQARRRRDTALACLALPLSMGAILFFLALREPEYVCQWCQRGGKRSRFRSGFCPYCGSPVVLE